MADFIYETNKGRQINFVSSQAEAPGIFSKQMIAKQKLFQDQQQKPPSFRNCVLAFYPESQETPHPEREAAFLKMRLPLARLSVGLCRGLRECRFGRKLSLLITHNHPSSSLNNSFLSRYACFAGLIRWPYLLAYTWVNSAPKKISRHEYDTHSMMTTIEPATP